MTSTSVLLSNARAKPTLLLLLAANLIPLFMVWLGSWQVGAVLLLFWLENVVVGVFNILRMLTCRNQGNTASKLFMVPFFTFHYGMFTLVHGVFLFAFFFNDPGSSQLDLTPAAVRLLFQDLNLLFPLLALVVSHGFSFVWHYLRDGEYRTVNVSELMARPYGRVIIMHVTILFGGFVVEALGQPVFALLLLIVLKIVIDAAAHLHEHKNAPE